MVKKDEHHASEVFGFLISLRFQPTTAGSPGSSEAIEAAAQMAVELRHIITGTGRQTWWAQSPWCWAHWWNQEPTLFWLVVDLPPEKYKFVSWDYDIPNIWKNNNHVSNHRPVFAKDGEHFLEQGIHVQRIRGSCWKYNHKIIRHSKTADWDILINVEWENHWANMAKYFFQVV